YIRPPHTFEAAVMYIHSESVYQEAVSMDMDEGGADLFTVAQRRKVLLSSPHTLLMHLRLIYSVVKNQRLSENVSKLVEMLNNLQPALEEVKDAFGKAKKQLNFAGTNLSEAEAALSQFEQRLQGVVSLPAETPQKIPLKSP
ncbi:MAG: DNA recombination protein RmuC, partial [Elusimicrobiota bacterium]